MTLSLINLDFGKVDLFLSTLLKFILLKIKQKGYRFIFKMYLQLFLIKSNVIFEKMFLIILAYFRSFKKSIKIVFFKLISIKSQKVKKIHSYILNP